MLFYIHTNIVQQLCKIKRHLQKTNTAGDLSSPPNFKYTIHTNVETPLIEIYICFQLVEYHLEFLTKHPGEVFFYGCKLCTHRFTSRNSFLIHMKLHDVRKRYPCGVCDKAYDRKFQLVHHLRLHTSDTPFECEVCFLAFSDEQQLLEHSRVHTSDKPFECRYCLKGFPQKKALIVHLRMHTGERPFPCQFCERTFTQKAHLQVCFLIHSSICYEECLIDLVFCRVTWSVFIFQRKRLNITKLAICSRLPRNQY